MQRKKKIHVGTHVILIAGSIIMLFPFFWMVLSSFKTVGEQMMIPMQILPSSFKNTENFRQALDAVPFLRLYGNTLLMIAGRVLCAVIFSSMAGYGFARMQFPFKNLLFGIGLLQMMVPGQIFIVPQYMMLSKINMLNTVFALVFPALVSAFGTFLLRQQYMSLPKELEEAAILDGCNPWQTFIKIMVPITKSTIASLAIFTALFAWKDLMWPLIANNDLNHMPLSAGLSVLQGVCHTNKGAMMAGSVIATVPMLVIYILCQKQFIEGIAQTGIKG